MTDRAGTKDLQGRALVTGASRGLGRALARSSRRGAHASCWWRATPRRSPAWWPRSAPPAARRTRSPPTSATRRDVHASPARRRRSSGRSTCSSTTRARSAPTPLRLLLDTECEDLERVLAVNLVGPFRLTKALAGSMVLRGAGLVVHVTSDAATEAYPRWGAYGVSKAALDHLGRVWAAELAAPACASSASTPAR